jgi:hypothetical protein
MVKYVAILLAVVGTFVVVDSAQARGHRGGCPGGHCYTGGCPGGVCAVTVAPAKTAAVTDDPKAVAEATAPVITAPVVTTQPAPRYVTTSRRLFGRR